MTHSSVSADASLRRGRLCVAPMMDWTDRHCRVFHRLLSPSALLYTEMVHAHAVVHGDRAHLIGFDAREHPVALQLGGSDPAMLAAASRIGEDFGYDEINLNVGCPSDRVQSGRFGACLMREPALVADCIAAMRAAVAIPVTVKCRIGVDDQDEMAGLSAFVDTVAATGCDTFIVHARKAWLKGLSPKENRDIPPLNHPRVYDLKRDRPSLTIIINGGITTVAQATQHLAHVDGVMIGRAAYHDPYVLALLEQSACDASYEPPSRLDVMARLEPYVRAYLAQGGRLHHVTRHIVGLFLGLPGARAFRRVLSDEGNRDGADWSVVETALAQLPGDVQRRAA